MKVYEVMSGRMMYAPSIDLALDINNELEEAMDVLATSKLDGHDEYCQALMELVVRYKDLLSGLSRFEDVLSTYPTRSFLIDKK